MNQVGKHAVREALTELADEAFQRRAWVGPSPASFTECTAQLWDDSGLADDLDRNRLVFSPTIDSELVSLKTLVHDVDDDNGRSDAEIVDDPHLKEVRLHASLLLQQIDQLN